MAGFIRRYSFFPGNEVITQIEGVVIIDLPPPGSIQGAETGVACCVGEFADMTYACTVDGSGAVTALIQPQECISSQDFTNKFGGFDETLGEFGDSEGNGYVSLYGKKFSRLICTPVFLASNYGCRFWRELPLCTSPTDVLPVVPVSGATVAAGREFRNSTAGRLRLAKPVVFTALEVFKTGTDGSITTAGGAVTQTFTSASGAFTTVVRPSGELGVKKGDIVVFGSNNSGARLPPDAGGNLGAGTYRVAADASAATTLSLERMDGASFVFVTAATLPYRIHISSDADSAPTVVLGAVADGGYKALDAGGSSIPVRALTDVSGAATDGVWTAALALTPAVVPPALTGNFADPLSGLAGITHATSTLAYTAAVQKPNVASSATNDALYVSALLATVSDLEPVTDINIIWCARTSSAIRTALKANVLSASSLSAGRVAIIRPDLDVQTTSAAVASADPGVGAVRDERVIYTWPGCIISVPEAVNYRMPTADGLTRLDGLLDVGFDSFMASLLSNLPPERNPGQAAPPVNEILATVLGIQRGVTKLELNDYIALKSHGIAALRIDKTAGPIVQSGITTSLTSGQTEISRRRMADFIEDSMAARLVSFSKLLMTKATKDSIILEANAFLMELKSETNPAAARIADGSIDSKSGNTAESEAANIFVIITKVRTIPHGNFIVVQTEVGNNVVVSTTLP